jgi:hypothetical protein
VFPNLLYFATWEYQVQRADGSTFDGSPTEQGLPLPPLVGVPYRGSLAGSTCVPVAGTLAYVTFANGDPARPILVAFGPTTATSATIDGSTVAVGPSASAVHLASGSDLMAAAGATGRVVRYGDLVSIPVVGAVATGAVTGMLPGPNPVSKVTA